MAGDDALRLDWEEYSRTVTKNLKSLVMDEEFVDVTLHAEGRTLKAHRQVDFSLPKAKT